MNNVWQAIIGCVVLSWVAAAPAQDGSRLYRMQDGDTLAELAEVYLGGREFAPELLEFNNIQNATALGPGMLIALPGPIRQEAIDRVAAAEEAVADALNAEADKYASAEFRSAKQSLETTKEFRLKAAYAKALGLAQRTIAMADEAKRLADANANVDEDGRVVQAFGTVHLSVDDGATWQPARSGDVLPLTAIIRTGPGSRAEVSLEDGSLFQVLEESELSIAQFRKDRRSGRFDAELRVLMGNIYGRIKPKKRDDSKLEIKTGKTSIAVRGTRLRAKIDDGGVTRAELLDGHVDVVSGNRSESLPPNHGVVVPPNKRAGKPIKLLPPPDLVGKWAGGLTTARQQPLLDWLHVKDRDREAYRVEIARDPDFNDLVASVVQEENQFYPEVLPQGDYLWRVSTIDDHRLEGESTQPRALRIRKDLSVTLEYRGDLVTDAAGRYVGSATNRYKVVPVAKDTSVTALEYSIDRGPFQVVTNEFVLPAGAEAALSVRGVGAEGDAGAMQEISLFVDGTPPQVSFELGQPYVAPDGAKKIRATLGTKDQAGIKSLLYSLDGRRFYHYREPLELSALHNYTIHVLAEDAVGNASPKLTFNVDGERARRGHIGLEMLRP